MAETFLSLRRVRIARRVRDGAIKVSQMLVRLSLSVGHAGERVRVASIKSQARHYENRAAAARDTMQTTRVANELAIDRALRACRDADVAAQVANIVSK